MQIPIYSLAQSQLYCEGISAEGVAAEEPIERNENGYVCI
jgi:hypothetical protein